VERVERLRLAQLSCLCGGWFMTRAKVNFTWQTGIRPGGWGIITREYRHGLNAEEETLESLVAGGKQAIGSSGYRTQTDPSASRTGVSENQQTVDAVLTAAQLVAALQSIVPRNAHPLKPAVLKAGEMHAGYRHNVGADTARLDCTIRSMDAETRQLLRDKIEQTVAGVTSAIGASCELVSSLGYPSAPNDWSKVDQVI
jgi:acetylornithine deacetylase/succinyl-diaminopimelate desuccinylase-like protein